MPHDRRTTDAILLQHIHLTVTFILLGFVGILHADFPNPPTGRLEGLTCPYQIELGDFNNDGRGDLALSSWHRLPVADESYDQEKSKVQLYFQRTDGTFAAPPDREFPIQTPWGLCSGDFDGDGKTDLAVKQTRRALHLLLGSEDFATLHSSVNINDGDRQVTAGRLSPGGLTDFLCGPAWRKWRGDDAFMVGYCYGPATNDNRGGVIADLNQDEHNDMVFLTPDAIRVYYGPFPSMTVRPGDLTALLEIKPPFPATSVGVADFTGDGRPDIVAALSDRESGKRAIALYKQDAPIDFSGNSAPTVLLDGVSGQLVTCDLNLDGLSDLVVADARARRIYVFLQPKGAALPLVTDQAHQVLETLCHSVSVADINGGGFPDLAVSDGKGQVCFYLNDGVFEPRKMPVPPAKAPPKPIAQAAVLPAPPPAAAHQPVLPETTGGNEAAGLLAMLPPPEKGPDHDDPLRMPFYTGVILPTPQKVIYRDEHYSLGTVGLLLGKELTPESPLVKRLQQRVVRFGGVVTIVSAGSAAVDTLIMLGTVSDTGTLTGIPAVPDREQAYIMTCVRDVDLNVVVLQGHDRLGLLWAVSSFNQLVHTRQDRPAVRAADIVDYPATSSRGFISGNWVNGADYCLAFKINKPVFQNALLERGPRSKKARYDDWRQPLSDAVIADLKAYGDALTPFGIEWYAGHNPTITDKKIRSADDRDFQVILEWACTVEQFGGHLCLKYDDHRFPLSSEDMERFGSAREADTHLLLRLHRELKERYPNAKILFCPPFYWGPHSPALYPEKRDDYLFALGARLPTDIELFWTGPSVKSGRVTPDMVSWISERLKRKPVYWQNGFAMPHMFLYHYVTDPIPVLNEWFYDGFLTDVDTYMFNCMMPTYAAAAAACTDYCWNPGAYDPDQSIREAATKLVGRDTYPAVVALNKALCFFDKFGLRRTPGAAKQLPEMGNKLAVVNAVWQEIQTNRNAAAVERWTGLERHITQVNRFHRALARSPNLADYRRDAGASQVRAESEVGFVEATDTFLSAYDFSGGYGPKHYANRCEKRLATWIYARRSANWSMEASFRVEPFPPETDYELVICAQDDDAEATCDIRITVNETVVFAGENPHVRFGWSHHTYRIPAAALSRQSRLLIENTEEGGREGGPPFFMLNYAVVRKVK